MFDDRTIKKHTITCFRDLNKCKGCGELMMGHEVEEHNKQYTDRDKVKSYALEGDVQKLNSSLIHGFDINTKYREMYNYSKYI